MRRLVPVVLAGGAGERLWPLSRAWDAKPFQSPFGGESLLRTTLARAASIATRRPVVVCGEAHRPLVEKQLNGLRGGRPRVLLEPAGRGTAPAMALAAHVVLAEFGDAPVLFMPADHRVASPARFAATVDAALAAAEGGDRPIVVFGVAPTRAATEYGYIEVASRAGAGARAVLNFAEKPGPASARGFLASGRHLWNTGMFLMHARTCLAEIGAHEPGMAAAVEAAFRGARIEPGVLRAGDAFLDSPRGSFDTVAMERTGNAVVVSAEFGWHDVGSWDAVLAAAERDAAGNRLVGDVIARDVTGSLIDARSRLVAAVGIEDAVVVETADAVLVARLDRLADLRDVVAGLVRDGRPESLAHVEVARPWGSYVCLERGAGHQVKRLRVDPGAGTSLQLHRQRVEHWVVVKGTAQVRCGDRRCVLHENESVHVPVGVKHRLGNPTDSTLEVIEVQLGDYLGEDDIVRFDEPGRAWSDRAGRDGPGQG